MWGIMIRNRVGFYLLECFLFLSQLCFLIFNGQNSSPYTVLVPVRKFPDSDYSLAITTIYFPYIFYTHTQTHFEQHGFSFWWALFTFYYFLNHWMWPLNKLCLSEESWIYRVRFDCFSLFSKWRKLRNFKRLKRCCQFDVHFSNFSLNIE